MASSLSARGRVPLTRRTLLHDRVRLAISLAGVGFAVLLVILLRGIMDGTIAKTTSYIENAGGDVIVAQSGVSNMLLASSVLPEELVSALAQEGEVDRSGAIVRAPTIVSTERGERPATLIGYVEGEIGGPWDMAAGRHARSGAEVVLDQALAGALHADLGDRVAIAGQEFEVVGLSRGTAALAARLVFVPRATAQELFGITGGVSFILLDLHPGVDPALFALALEAQAAPVSAVTKEELVANDRKLLGDLFIAPVNVMSGAGFLVGLAIVGLTMYTTTAERLRDFGVLKAIGASHLFLVRTVLGEAAVLASVGFVLGLAGAWLSGPVATRIEPDIDVSVTYANALRAFGALVLMSLVGALTPLVRILRVDPLIVFRR